MKWSFIDRFPLDDGLIEAFRHLISEELLKFNPDVREKVVILFSAHALPMSVSYFKKFIRICFNIKYFSIVIK